jgi:mono/diheme cytochrome c family protein
MTSSRVSYSSVAVAFSALVFSFTVACVNGNPAADMSDPGLPYGPVPVNPSQPVAYVQDIKPIFDRDCLECHNSRRAEGGYSASTYAQSIDGQHAGDARSSVVVDTAPGGSMYVYFTGDATTRATLVFRWVVANDLAQTR